MRSDILPPLTHRDTGAEFPA